MKSAFLILILFLCCCNKKSNNNNAISKVDSSTLYTYTQCLSNLGIVTGKQYTLGHIDSFSTEQRDTIVFNSNETVTETAFITPYYLGNNTNQSQTYSINVKYDSNGAYTIQESNYQLGETFQPFILHFQLYTSKPFNYFGYIKNEVGIIEFRFGTYYFLKII